EHPTSRAAAATIRERGRYMTSVPIDAWGRSTTVAVVRADKWTFVRRKSGPGPCTATVLVSRRQCGWTKVPWCGARFRPAPINGASLRALRHHEARAPDRAARLPG